MNITDRTLIRQITEAYAATQTKVPKPLADALDRATRLAEAVQTMGPHDGALGVAVTLALDESRDPAACPEVQRVLTAMQLVGNRNLSDQIAGGADDRVREQCRDLADQIIGAWAKPFTAAAQTLEGCFTRIGPVPLADTTSIMALGDDIATVWAQAQTASKVIETIAAGWMGLGEFTRTVPTNPDYRVLRLADVDFDTWQAHNLRRARLAPWEFLLAGLTLTLPTRAEYRQRVQSITDAMAQPETVIDRQRSLVAGREIRVDAATGREVNAA